jgi:hypothetical protein
MKTAIAITLAVMSVTAAYAEDHVIFATDFKDPAQFFVNSENGTWVAPSARTGDGYFWINKAVISAPRISFDALRDEDVRLSFNYFAGSTTLNLHPTVSLDGVSIFDLGTDPTYTTTFDPGINAPSHSFSQLFRVSAGAHYFEFKATGTARLSLDDISVTTPIPEPQSYAMMLAGLGLLGVVRRHRKTMTSAS